MKVNRRFLIMAAGMLLLFLALLPDWPGLLDRLPTTGDNQGYVIEVAGARYTPLADIRRAMVSGETLLGVKKARQALIALPWIADASVRRLLDGRIAVRVDEHRPFALWQREGTLWVVNQAGMPISRHGLDRFSDLPLLVGDGAAQAAPAMLSLLDQHRLDEREVYALVRVGQRRWDIVFDNGVKLSLPQDNAPEDDGNPAGDAWARFIVLEQQHQLLDREVLRVDMRLADRIVLRLTNRGRAKLGIAQIRM